MFKVGDVIKVVNGRRGDRYKVISIDINNKNEPIVLRNIRQTSSSMNFSIRNFNGMEIDKIYYRKHKLEKICSKLETL